MIHKFQNYNKEQQLHKKDKIYYTSNIKIWKDNVNNINSNLLCPRNSNNTKIINDKSFISKSINSLLFIKFIFYIAFNPISKLHFQHSFVIFFIIFLTLLEYFYKHFLKINLYSFIIISFALFKFEITKDFMLNFAFFYINFTITQNYCLYPTYFLLYFFFVIYLCFY